MINLGNRVVNNYLIPSEAGYILIDTGYAGAFPRFMKGLAKRRISPEAIKYVFLTHAHDDHAGFLNEVLAGDILFCGDAAMSGFPSVRRTIIWIEDLRQYRQSWKKILQKSPALLCPGHGRPFKTSDLSKYLGSLDSVRLYPLR